MNKKDQEIQKKLDELETTILKEQNEKRNLPAKSQDKDPLLLTSSKSALSTAPATQNDLFYFGGIGLIILSLVQMFQHVRVGSGLFSLFGMGGGGFGMMLIPLMVGIGWLIYDPKNKIGWLLTAGVCGLIVLSVLGSLVMYFPMLSFMEMIMMLLPMAIGAVLLLKGIGGPKALEEKLKKLR